MPVNLTLPDNATLHAVRGLRLGVAAVGIRYPDHLDLLVIELADNTQVAGVFTKNRFAAAPVQLCREHLAHPQSSTRALVINTGCANACTGLDGRRRAMEVCEALATQLNIKPTQVLPFSTGSTLDTLPHEKIIAALPAALTAASQGSTWLQAAQAIMTTDTQPKAVSRQIQLGSETITITGIAKGAGMIQPNMATMLGFIATDAKVAPAALSAMVKYAANRSFNCITIDGDTSTNDSFMLIATGQTTVSIESETSANFLALRDAITDIAQTLAQAIVRDGEGATKFITLQIDDGQDEHECKAIGYSIACSPLVKTAFFGGDPNWGRILVAIGKAGIDDLDANKIDLYLNGQMVVAQGMRNPDYQEADGQHIMQQKEINVRVVLHRGMAKATVWTCDFSLDYVKINADYRS